MRKQYPSIRISGEHNTVNSSVHFHLFPARGSSRVVSTRRAWLAAAVAAAAGLFVGNRDISPQFAGCAIAAMLVTLCVLLREGQHAGPGEGESQSGGSFQDGHSAGADAIGGSTEHRSQR